MSIAWITDSPSPTSPSGSDFPPTARRVYAVDVDWVTQRSTISSLYKSHTLSEVIDFMEREHSFYATYVSLKPQCHPQHILNECWQTAAV
jgi:hypothetical protein